MRLIDADALKNSILDSHPDDLQQSDINFDTGDIKIWLSSVLKFIDNAPTVPLPDFKEGYKQAIIDGKTNFSRPEGEYTEEDIKQTIKENFDIGYEMAKNKYKRPQGEWKHEIISDKSCVLCSICNLHFDNESNFCPNCGAEMEKGGAE